MKNFKILYVLVLAITLASVLTSCNKDNLLYGGNYDITANINSDGIYDVVGTVDIDISKDEFTAEIEIDSIAGIADAHTITLNGTMEEPGSLVIKDEVFVFDNNGVSETVTVSAQILTAGLGLIGDGTLVIESSAGSRLGLFAISGTKL